MHLETHLFLVSLQQQMLINTRPMRQNQRAKDNRNRKQVSEKCKGCKSAECYTCPFCSTMKKYDATGRLNDCCFHQQCTVMQQVRSYLQCSQLCLHLSTIYILSNFLNNHLHHNVSNNQLSSHKLMSSDHKQ